jgi:hypothetical protein
MRKAILKDGQHTIDGDDNLYDSDHSNADQFNFQTTVAAVDQHTSNAVAPHEKGNSDHPQVFDHAHIDYTILSPFADVVPDFQNAPPIGINDLGEVATPSGLFDKDGHELVSAFAPGGGYIGFIDSIDNAGDVARWTHNYVTYADGTNVYGNLGPVPFQIGPAGEPVNAVQHVYMNVNNEFAGSYVVGDSEHPKYIDQYGNFEIRGFTQSGIGGPMKDFMVPGSTQTFISGLNDHGDLAGMYRDMAGAMHGFLDHNGKITTIDAPSALGPDGRPIDATSMQINGLNNLDQLVGAFATRGPNQDGFGNEFGFIYDHGKFIFVGGPVPTTSASTQVTILYGINDHGDVVGYENHPTSNVILAFEAHVPQLQQATTATQQTPATDGESVFHQIVDHSNHS